MPSSPVIEALICPPSWLSSSSSPLRGQIVNLARLKEIGQAEPISLRLLKRPRLEHNALEKSCKTREISISGKMAKS